MNIFATNSSPVTSAVEHCDVHLRKMIIELAQLLSTAHVVLDGNEVAYKATHVNHPCSKWVRDNRFNYQWAYRHFEALCMEFKYRFKKHHACEKHLLALYHAPTNIKYGNSIEPFAMAMPDEYKKLGIIDQTKAYQAYLNDKFKEWGCRAKPIKVEWTNRNQPYWYI